MWTLKESLPVVLVLVFKILTHVDGAGMGITYPGQLIFTATINILENLIENES